MPKYQTDIRNTLLAAICILPGTCLYTNVNIKTHLSGHGNYAALRSRIIDPSLHNSPNPT